MTYNYRFIPTVMRAYELIQDGALGTIYRFQAEYLHTGYQDAGRPLWKGALHNQMLLTACVRNWY